MKRKLCEYIHKFNIWIHLFIQTHFLIKFLFNSFCSHAKHLIEDTIRRNASPVRHDESASGVVGAGSCSSLTSSNSDDTQMTRVNRSSVAGMPSAMCYSHMPGNQKVRGAPGQVLLHSLSTNDASVGEYKYTVNVGTHSIKITGDSIDLVRVSIAEGLFRLTKFVSPNCAIVV